MDSALQCVALGIFSPVGKAADIHVALATPVVHAAVGRMVHHVVVVVRRVVHGGDSLVVLLLGASVGVRG